jgi:hypothetical protein
MFILFLIFYREKPSKLYFDLEYETAANVQLDGPRLTSNFIQVVIDSNQPMNKNMHGYVRSSLFLILCVNEAMI